MQFDAVDPGDPVVAAHPHSSITVPPSGLTTKFNYPTAISQLIESYEVEEIEVEDIDWEDHDALRKRWPSIPWWPSWPWHWLKKTRTHTVTNTHTYTVDYIVHGTETSESTVVEFIPSLLISIIEEWVTELETSVKSSEIEEVSTLLLTTSKEATQTSTEEHLEIITSLTTRESLYESTIVQSSEMQTTVLNSFTRTTYSTVEVLTSTNKRSTVVSTRVSTSDLDTITYSIVKSEITTEGKPQVSATAPASVSDATTVQEPTLVPTPSKVTVLSESTVRTVLSTEETHTMDYWVTSKVLTSVELVQTGVEESETTYYTLVTSVSTSTSFETITSLNTLTSYDYFESLIEEEDIQTALTTSTSLQLLTLVKTITTMAPKETSYLTTHLSTLIYTIEREHEITSHSLQTSIEISESEEEYSEKEAETGYTQSSTHAQSTTKPSSSEYFTQSSTYSSNHLETPESEPLITTSYLSSTTATSYTTDSTASSLISNPINLSSISDESGSRSSIAESKTIITHRFRHITNTKFI
ncbi:hypothetical protein DAKH74_051320 [Maudiozyma humilis]|uniref:Uncharacterized protein n=1 Tax=Maudiozyma humilis TaxID=51915 RepID=A0AAV5S472_MAUHU|nr:hypothetical protein DAKH74_051320 [Kazachstania humilis]